MFGEEHVVAGGISGALFGLDLVARGEHAVAVWSDQTASHARELTTRGEPRGEARRIGPPCDGGLDAEASGSTLVVACLRRAVVEADKRGEVTLLWLDPDLAVRRRRAFGRAGRHSRGVAMASDGGRLTVAWHDGTPGDLAVWTAEVIGAEPGEPRRLSRPGLAAGAPSVLSRSPRAAFAWAETWLDDDGLLVGQVLVGDGRGASHEAAVIIHEDARPVLARHGGGLLLGYRDEQPAGSRPRLIVQRLGDDLRPEGNPVIVGRANGDGGPTILPCEGAITTLAPRSFGGRDVLVGINRLGPGLRRLQVERQIYQYGAAFGAAAAICAGDHHLVLVGERASDPRPGSLQTTVVDCR